MNTLSFSIFLVILSTRRTVDSSSRDMWTCHDDFGLKAPDGILKKNTFGWLGFVQYTHVTTGLPHMTIAPRVLLIHKQFVIGTAVDFFKFPRNFKRGSVIFGEYDREEKSCGITRIQMKQGIKCPYAYFETQLIDITPHPEYTRFGVGNSLALGKLLQPIKSNYMMPICMPSLTERRKKRRDKFVFMVDYVSNVPQDFDLERMGKKTLKMYNHKECRTKSLKTILSSGLSHVLCSTGCGIRHGAPIVSHNNEGTFELIGIAAGGTLCKTKFMRRRFSKDPPLYIDVYPYKAWLTNVITAHEIPLAYPQNFRRTEGGTSIGLHTDYLRRRKPQKSGWRGHAFLSGNFCFRSAETRQKAAFIYSELFLVKSNRETTITVNMKISAGIECTVVCARLILPSQETTPRIKGVGGYNVSVRFTTELYPEEFTYALGLFVKNTTNTDYNTWFPEYTAW